MFFHVSKLNFSAVQAGKQPFEVRNQNEPIDMKNAVWIPAKKAAKIIDPDGKRAHK